MRVSALDIFHPAFSAAYFIAVLAFCMLAFHPVFLALSLAGGIAYGCYLRGGASVARGLLWQLPLIAVVAVFNAIFAGLGSTELFHMGTQAVYLESGVYGLCMGIMLVAVILWFENAACVLTSDKMMMLTGNAMPTVGLMIAMVGRFVPLFLRRGSEISDAVAMNAVCAHSREEGGASPGFQSGEAAKQVRKRQRRSGMRQLSVLMGWSMEDSLETAMAMRARGWGAAARRSTYRYCRFRKRDGLAIAALAALLSLCGVCAFTAVSQFTFYPALSHLIVWWGYIPYLLLVFGALVMEGIEALRWR